MLPWHALLSALLLFSPLMAMAQDDGEPAPVGDAPLPEPPADDEPGADEPPTETDAAEAELEAILEEGHETVEGLEEDLPEPPDESDTEPETEQPEAEAEPDEEVEWLLARTALRDGTVRWAVSADVLTARAPADVWIFAYGLGLSRHLGAELSVGVQQISLGIGTLVQGRRWALSMAPYAEYAPFLVEYFQAVTQAGVAVQSRFGGRIRATYGASPFASAGGRVWVGSLISTTLLLRAHYVASAGFLFPTKVVPRHGVALLAGMSLEVHL